MSDNDIRLHDTSIRDGIQSNWGMLMNHNMIQEIVGDIANAGYDSFEIPLGMIAHGVLAVRQFGEDPWETFHMIGREVKGSQSKLMHQSTLGMLPGGFGEPGSKGLIRFLHEVEKEALGGKFDQTFIMCGTRDEIKNECPIFFPLLRDIGIDVIPYVAIGHSPRHTDEFYAKAVNEICTKYKPTEIVLKDVDGLLTAERAKTLIPTFINNAHGVPVTMHVHGMSGQNSHVFVEAMKLGVTKFQTCIPPLAWGASHPSVFNTMDNARQLGLGHTMDVDLLRSIEERLMTMGRQAGRPVDNHPLPLDVGVYSHQVPGGVISTLKEQLRQLKLTHKLDEVLEEIPHILEDLGYPVMITPHSQFIVAQAVLNVATGERWQEPLDSMVEFACGVYGWEDAGVPYMNQNLRDKLLSRPTAKKAQESVARQQEIMNEDFSINEMKKNFGMPDASDEDFALAFMLHGPLDELKKIRAKGGPETYQKYYTGKEPLGVILDGMKKDVDLSRLEVQRGNSIYEINKVRSIV